MKRLLLVILLLFVSGCSVVRIDTTNIDNIVDLVISKDKNLYNQIGKGYKYYIPRGLSYIDTNKYNDILYSNGNYYYLYIDVISYYHNIAKEYHVNNNAYYSKVININDKTGYLEINEHEGKYFIEFMYNYAKIETIVLEKDINESVLNASYILSTINFNDNVIKIMLNDEFLEIDEQYDIFASKKTTDDFLKLETEESRE